MHVLKQKQKTDPWYDFQYSSQSRYRTVIIPFTPSLAHTTLNPTSTPHPDNRLGGRGGGGSFAALAATNATAYAIRA